MHHGVPLRILLLLLLLCCLGAGTVTAVENSPAIAWQKLVGGSGNEYPHDIQQTTDGGYIILGESNSHASGNVLDSNHGGLDMWVVRLSSARTILWQSLLGGAENEYGYAVRQTSDGGFILAGTSYSTATAGTDITEANHGGTADFWVVKLAPNGVIQWQRLLGGFGEDRATSVDQTADGGYIVLGQTSSDTGGDVLGYHRGLTDYWLVRLDPAGAVLWERQLGGRGHDFGMSVRATTDGGYVVAGTSYSSRSDDVVDSGHFPLGAQPTAELWVVKMDSGGTAQWQILLGGFGEDFAESIEQTADGGYIVVGNTDSATGEITGWTWGMEDIWVVKLTAAGAVQWQRTYGGSGREQAFSVDQAMDGGYLVLGSSTSSRAFDVHDTNNDPAGLLLNVVPTADLWALKLDGTGELLWEKLLGGEGNDNGHAVDGTADGGCVLLGDAWSSASGDMPGANHGGNDFWVVKLAPALPPTPPPTPPPGVTVPGGSQAPTDTDGDEKYDDVNGNHRKDFADIVLYFNQMSWIAKNEPLPAFDYNANGRIDFADVVWLFNRL